eukprot:m.101797 g.101797  ORF g.101797 m.101797 type:complete len:361 (-) comp15667_c0_seq1:158-1240(-)
MSEDVPLQGYLKKKGRKGLYRTMVQRWFEYDDKTGQLKYYHSRGDKSPRGYINLSCVQSITLGDPALNRFNLNITNGEWLLEAENYEMMIFWMEALLLRKKNLPTHDTDSIATEMHDDEDGDDDDGKSKKSVDGGPIFFAGGHDAGLLDNVIDESEHQTLDSLLVPEDPNSTKHMTTLDDDDYAPSKREQQPCKECAELREHTVRQQQELRAKTDVIALMQAELTSYEREAALKSQALRQLQTQLAKEEESRANQLRTGSMSHEELQQRLVWRNADVAHTRALLDLTNSRLAGALESVCLYKSMMDGSEHGEKDREACLLAQLAEANQTCNTWEERYQRLEAEFKRVQAQLDARLELAFN